jgi:hypothetical protein
VKAIDLARDARTAGELALVLADELLAAAPSSKWVSFPRASGSRSAAPRSTSRHADRVIDADSVVVATAAHAA